MITRNTKQKEIILEILTENRIHPTIQEIYKLAKAKYKNIGQATIYRNVNKLVEENKVLRLPSIKDEGYHYDINITAHNHLICNRCGKIVDIFDNSYESMINKIEQDNLVKITNALLILEGICSKCQKKQQMRQ